MKPSGSNRIRQRDDDAADLCDPIRHKTLGNGAHVDRRKFIESLSGACLATQLKLTSKTMLLNSAVLSDPNVSVAAEQVRIVPIPASIPNVQNPVVNLAGTWQFAPIPPAEVWKPDFDLSKWHEIKVPCELAMEGFDISPDVEYPCRRTVHFQVILQAIASSYALTVFTAAPASG